MDEETLDIQEIVSLRSNGRYFIIDNRVYSHEQEITTKVSYFRSFNSFLKSFLDKIIDCYYSDSDRRPSRDRCHHTQDGVLTFRATYDCDHSDDYYVDLRSSSLSSDELKLFVNHLNLRIAARGSRDLAYELENLNKVILGITRPKKEEKEGEEEEEGEGAKVKISNRIRFHMIIPFLEAGKKPLSEKEQDEFLKVLDHELNEVNEVKDDYTDIDYILQGISGLKQLDSILKMQPECSIGSKEWIQHHKQYMITYHPDWKCYDVYESGLILSSYVRN